MSIERAEVNCKRCYVLVQRIDSNHASDVDRKVARESIIDEISLSDPLYNARNGAMMALEESIRTDSRAKKMAEKGLKACVTCNYEAPRIANIVSK